MKCFQRIDKSFPLHSSLKLTIVDYYLVNLYDVFVFLLWYFFYGEGRMVPTSKWCEFYKVCFVIVQQCENKPTVASKDLAKENGILLWNFTKLHIAPGEVLIEPQVEIFQIKFIGKN